METWVLKVSSVLTHTRGARDCHQCGRDPRRMEGKRSGVMWQNLRKGLDGRWKENHLGLPDFTNKNTGRPVKLELKIRNEFFFNLGQVYTKTLLLF